MACTPCCRRHATIAASFRETEESISAGDQFGGVVTRLELEEEEEEEPEA